METFRPSPRTVNACRFSAVGASKRASTPLTNHSYIILSRGGSLTPEEFHRFWDGLSHSISNAKRY